MFARSAIEAFSRPGDVVLDPFMGGATTLVECRSLGRHAAGNDVSSLCVFLARVKATPLGERDIQRVVEWVWDLPEHLNLHLPPVRAIEWHRMGYQRSLPWPIRKIIELALARLGELSSRRQQRFARCLFLKVGQWALDCRSRIPSAEGISHRAIRCFGFFRRWHAGYPAGSGRQSTSGPVTCFKHPDPLPRIRFTES